MDQFRATTIVAVRKDNRLAIAGDGQVTFGQNMIMKNKAKKIRSLYGGKILAGFAGASADAFTLFELYEKKLEEYNGQIVRAAVELGKQWRTDRTLRNLEALMIVGNPEHLLVISGTGDIIEPDDDVIAIGSGGAYALSAAKALMKHSKLSVGEIAREALEIAASICVYTNNQITVMEIGNE
ncbi:MAG: ATP-dependent protease subunit HslV [Firmicutes bacterium]|nr:ATP-dependent protease subunit HslV [Bacillota bacterium]